MEFMADVPEALVTFLVTGDWTMLNSNRPEKVSVMLLGIFRKPSDSKDAFESRSRMKIHQIKGAGWDKDLNDKMSKFEFCRTENIYKLKHQLKTVVCFFSIVPGKESVLVNQLSILMNKSETN